MAKDYLYYEATDTKIYSNDVVTISSYPDVKFIAKNGWYKLGTAQKNGWYFINIATRSIIPIDDINIEEITKDIEQGTTELRPTLKDIDTQIAENNFIVIPGTNVRLYDGDIVKISTKPRVKWIVHLGWYIYQDAQNFGWYFVSIKDGEIAPVSIIDLTLCTLVTTKTQGSGIEDGKVINYTRPFTLEDAQTLNRTFISLDTIEQRDNIDPKHLVNGRIVRVNNVGGASAYYIWNSSTNEWNIFEDFSIKGIPEVIGTNENPIILSELEPGLYRVKGVYKISPDYEMITFATIDHLAFVNEDDDIDIKVITDSSITDYIVEGDAVTFVNNYATYQYLQDNYASKEYVDSKVAVLEAEISEIISTFRDKVIEIVYECLNDSLDNIHEDYINNLFD